MSGDGSTAKTSYAGDSYVVLNKKPAIGMRDLTGQARG